MGDPVKYSFYGTTIPVLRKQAESAISILTAAKDELSKDDKGALPSEEQILNAQIGDMLPFRVQPILLAKFSVVALQHLHLQGSTTVPAFDPSFASLDAVISFFKQVQAVYDAVDESVYNECAEKSVDIPFEQSQKTLHMTGLADFVHGFVIPNAYFHLNAMYMLLRLKGFKLGKRTYIGSYMSEQQKKDWAPLQG